MERINARFEILRQSGRKALISFITAGDPSVEATIPMMHALVAGGTDIIELGIPFSDPMADGPTIQRASERALVNGMTLRKVIEIVSKFRQVNENSPIVLMGYANPIEAMGVETFAKAAQAAGVDGVLVVDYPPEECEEFAKVLKAHDLAPIFLVAPTSTEERIRQVGQIGSGYIYYVSLKGVTGSGNLDLDEVTRRIPQIQKTVGMPVGVGFGIRDAESAKKIASVADAVVIGSRIIEEIERSSPEDAPVNVRTFLRGIRAALDEN